MSLLPQQILPQTAPLGIVNELGEVTIDKNWWLLLFNICQQVLIGGGSLTLNSLALFKAQGIDYERQIADLVMLVASLPSPAGRIAALEKRVAELENLLYCDLKVT